jgi:hypothetical protein
MVLVPTVRRPENIVCECRCGAILRIPTSVVMGTNLVREFWDRHVDCTTNPPPPVPKVVKRPATEMRGL